MEGRTASGAEWTVARPLGLTAVMHTGRYAWHMPLYITWKRDLELIAIGKEFR